MITSYLDVCIRLHLNRHGTINLHLLAINLYEMHMAVGIFATAANDLGVLCTPRKDTVIII